MNDVSEQFLRINLAGVERAEAVARIAFGAFERLAALNLATCRRTLATSEAEYRRYAAMHPDPRRVLGVQSVSVREQSRVAADYARRIMTISRETSHQLARTVGD